MHHGGILPKVLAFGHLPKEAGGRQRSGLSYAAFEIARGIASLEGDLEYVLCCTDVSSSVKRVIQLGSGIKVIGWTRKSLIAYSILHPGLAVKFLAGAVRHRSRYRLEPGLLRTLGTLLFYSAAVHFYTPDLLHVHDASRAVLLDLIPNTKGLHRVTTLHGAIGFDESFPSGCQVIERDALRTSSYFVFVSNKMKSTLLSHYKSVSDKYAVIPNGVDLQKFRLLDRNQCRYDLGLPLDKTMLLTVGSLSKLKGQALILDSVASLTHEVRERICCVFVGNGVSSLRYKQAASGVDLRLYEHVEQEKLVQFYNAADYHLSASSSEGFGMVMTESLACGTPIILPKTCDLVEEDFVVDGVNSVIFDSPARDNIQDVIEHALEARFSREKVRDTVANMSWGHVAIVYRELFYSLTTNAHKVGHDYKYINLGTSVASK
jgi:glycosyltransferase involved in cell wall biosynthesis